MTNLTHREEVKLSDNSLTITDKNVQSDLGGSMYFQSRFKAWLRIVAAIVLFVFIPDQISWAFNYNPSVLWGSKNPYQQVVEKG